MKISIDGNFGVGKTRYLKQLVNEGYKVNWAQSNHSFPMGSLAFYLQMLQPLIIKTDIVKITNTVTHDADCSDSVLGDQIILYERSPYTLQHVYTDFDNPDELFLYRQIIEPIYWSPDAIIYLFCHPSFCQQQTKNISDNSLIGFHYRYENVLDELNCQIPIYKINAQEEPNQVLGNIKDILQQFKKRTSVVLTT